MLVTGLHPSSSFVRAVSSSSSASGDAPSSSSSQKSPVGVGLGLTLDHGHGSSSSFLDDYFLGADDEGLSHKRLHALPLPSLQLLVSECDPSLMILDTEHSGSTDDKPRGVPFPYEVKAATFAVVPAVAASDGVVNDDQWGDVLSLLCGDDALCFGDGGGGSSSSGGGVGADMRRNPFSFSSVIMCE